MFVLSSPSGAGKTTISRALLEREPELVMSVSATTRPRRPGEVEGEDYFFVDPQTFNELINRRELLEHAKVFGNYYGTPSRPVEGTGGRQGCAVRHRLAGHPADFPECPR
jgi:guanylate kinase